MSVHKIGGRSGRALSEAEVKGRISPYAIAAIRFLILSGSRVGEVLGMRWEWVDFERACVFLPDSKTGKKVIPLGAPALQLLQGLPKMAGNPYVFPGKSFGRHIFELTGSWNRIKKAAGLKGVRIHDLRHSWASQAAAAGLSLPFIVTVQELIRRKGGPVVITPEAARLERLAREEFGSEVVAYWAPERGGVYFRPISICNNTYFMLCKT